MPPQRGWVQHLGEVAASHGYFFLFPQIHACTHAAKHNFSLTKVCFDGEYILCGHISPMDYPKDLC